MIHVAQRDLYCHKGIRHSAKAKWCFNSFFFRKWLRVLYFKSESGTVCALLCKISHQAWPCPAQVLATVMKAASGWGLTRLVPRHINPRLTTRSVRQEPAGLCHWKATRRAASCLFSLQHWVSVPLFLSFQLWYIFTTLCWPNSVNPIHSWKHLLLSFSVTARLVVSWRSFFSLAKLFPLY